LKNPAWIGEEYFYLFDDIRTDHTLFQIDGAIDHPHFYFSHEEIEAALCAAGVSSNTYADQQAALSTPTPNHYANIKSQGQTLGEGRNIVNPTSSASKSLQFYHYDHAR